MCASIEGDLFAELNWAGASRLFQNKQTFFAHGGGTGLALDNMLARTEREEVSW